MAAEFEATLQRPVNEALTGADFSAFGFLISRRNAYTAKVRNLGIFAVALLLTAAYGDNKPTLRWLERRPNCTVRVADDGHIYYGISSADFEITVALDRQELEKVPHRAIPMLGLFLSFHYQGRGMFRVSQQKVTLEFVRHRHVVQHSLNPDSLLRTLETDADELTHHVERHEIRKHPEDREKKEAELNAHLRDYAEMKDFIRNHALREVTLEPNNSSVSGWVFFSTENEWIGRWRKPEQFILRLPAGDWMLEFPFQLPPQIGGVELRRRPAR
jgi:hypothetical protein